ncbi:MAG: serine hydrolase domain-containing protein [Ilumatobacteraceae bacterium]
MSTVSAGVIDHLENIHMYGDTNREFRLASVTKLMTAWATLVAVEDGSVNLDDEIGQPGCTLRHLLSHAGGYGFDNKEAIIKPERKRVYSNTGYELVAEHVSAATGFEFADYLHESVFDPLGMNSSRLIGSAAGDVNSTLGDLIIFMGELRKPRLIASSTYLEATSSQFPDLEGLVPGVGRFNPCPWGLGPELRGTKHPHWTATRNSSSTFGHFGGSGTFVWIDPVANVACCALSGFEFGQWSLTHWPVFGDEVLAELGR